jgi:hypothetical protein
MTWKTMLLDVAAMALKGATLTDSAPFCTAYAGGSCRSRASYTAVFVIELILGFNYL